MKKYVEYALKNLPRILAILLAAAGLLVYAKDTTAATRDGVTLLLGILIPSLFPFMVLSAYIVNSGALEPAKRLFKPIMRLVFRLGGSALPAVVMGCIGGYPVGAMTTAALYNKGEISQNEAERLMLFAINPGPAFLITAVGEGMLKNEALGTVLYVSVILSSLTIGVFLRFLSQDGAFNNAPHRSLKKENAFMQSVTEASSGMLGVAGWVLVFSCIGGMLKAINVTGYTAALLSSLLEVTTGCRSAAGLLPVPAIAAVAGFGGAAVLCQIKPYTDACDVSMKRLVVIRLLNAALSAFICSQLLLLLKNAVNVSAVVPSADKIVFSAYSLPASAVLLLMCAVFVLDMDNKRKMC